MDNNKKSYSKISKNIKLKTIFLILFFTVLFIMLFIFHDYFWPFLFALVFFIALKPVYDFLIKYLKNKLAAIISLLASFIILVVVPFFFLTFSLVKQTNEFYNYLTGKPQIAIEQNVENSNDVTINSNLSDNSIDNQKKSISAGKIENDKLVKDIKKYLEGEKLNKGVFIYINDREKTVSGDKIKEGKLVKDLKKYIRGNKFIKETLTYFNVSEQELLGKLFSFVGVKFELLINALKDIVSFSINLIISFIFMIIFMFFMFSKGETISSRIYNIIPFPDDIEKNIYERLKEVIKVLVTGNFLIMLLQGTMVGLGYLIFGLKGSILAGSIAAIFSLVPVIGTSVVVFPAVLYLFATGRYISGALLLIWGLFWYIFFENILKTKIFGKKLDFHPMVFFFLLLGSIKTFNLPGVILGPVLLTLFFSLWEIYEFLDIYGVSPGKK